MVRSRLRSALTDWRTWADLGALVFFAWFLLLLFRPRVVSQAQSFLLAQRWLVPHFPHGIATPRVVGEALPTVGMALGFAVLLVTLLLLSGSNEADRGAVGGSSADSAPGATDPEGASADPEAGHRKQAVADGEGAPPGQSRAGE